MHCWHPNSAYGLSSGPYPVLALPPSLHFASNLPCFTNPSILSLSVVASDGHTLEQRLVAGLPCGFT